MEHNKVILPNERYVIMQWVDIGTKDYESGVGLLFKKEVGEDGFGSFSKT